MIPNLSWRFPRSRISCLSEEFCFLRGKQYLGSASGYRSALCYWVGHNFSPFSVDRAQKYDFFPLIIYFIHLYHIFYVIYIIYIVTMYNIVYIYIYSVIFPPKSDYRDFPGGPVAKTPCSQCSQLGFNPW